MLTAIQKQNFVQQQTEINVQLFAYREKALMKIKNSQSANTRRVYDDKQIK
jgi:hypothetical protein